ncbi:MAG: NmrA family NAD(P)-binding protein, partial [Gammaproteobacteria bacterium]|nr:NmrA family NAD(P)-binding protein [Gammaproteobacteria bacterium]
MLYRFSLYLLIALFMVACAATGTGEPETILVGGATGRQGNAVVDELLARGYRVRGLTRKPGGKKALALAAKGVEVVQGDYADSGSLLAAMEGVSRVFFYSGFSRNEVAEGKNVIVAANEAAIDHLIYSSGAAAEPGHGIEGAAKMQVEIALVESGVPYTVFRPVAFMENFRGQQARTDKNGITDSRAPDRLLHFISIPDIGFLVAEAFDFP